MCDMTFYTYTMTHDTGFAPAVSGGLLSLACCKTRLRYAIARAFLNGEREILLLGLCGKQLAKKHGLQKYYPVYIAKVSDVVKCQDYHQLPLYADRPDRQYRYENGQWLPESTNPHKESADLMRRDLFYNGNKENYVLLCDKYVYFGRNQDVTLPACFNAVQDQREKASRASGKVKLNENEMQELSAFFDAHCSDSLQSNANCTIEDYFLAGKGQCGCK